MEKKAPAAVRLFAGAWRTHTSSIQGATLANGLAMQDPFLSYFSLLNIDIDMLKWPLLVLLTIVYL